MRDTTDFLNATSKWNCNKFGVETAWVCEPPDVALTQETIDDFITSRGKGYDLYQTPVGDLYVWENVQSRPGKRRGNLFLMDRTDRRLTYFDGEG